MNTSLHPALVGLEPKLVFELFDAVRQIPRNSNEELKIRQFLEQFAASRGWPSQSDAHGNLVVRVPAIGKGAQQPPIVLQSHLDMVCVKTPDSKHNFSTDAIQLERTTRVFVGQEVEVIKARDTTLGADNGIGIALALAAALSPEIAHRPPLELLFTLGEEIGLVGALKLDPALITGRSLINLDAFDSDEICIGCAASVVLWASWCLTREPSAAECQPFTVRIRGLPGGHSGVDIHEDRPSAVVLLIAALRWTQQQGLKLAIAGLSGGLRGNAIAEEASAQIWIAPQEQEELSRFFARTSVYFSKVAAVHPKLEITVQQLQTAPHPWHGRTAAQVLEGLSQIPHGVLSWSPAIPDLVESSNNLAILETQPDKLRAMCMARSSSLTKLEAFQAELRVKLANLGAQIYCPEEARGNWHPDPDAALCKLTKETFEKTLGQQPKVLAIHAGVECGHFVSRIPGLQAVSIGPDIRNAHSPEECLIISSVGKSWTFLKALVERLAQGL